MIPVIVVEKDGRRRVQFNNKTVASQQARWCLCSRHPIATASLRTVGTGCEVRDRSTDQEDPRRLDTWRSQHLLAESKGRVVNISSVAGFVAWPLLGPYAMSKQAIEAYSDALRAEMAVPGVTVVAIEPASCCR